MGIKHYYGPRIHLSDNPAVLSLIARFGEPSTGHPELPDLLRSVYRFLAVEAFGRELPVKQGRVSTRMRFLTPKGVYKGPVLIPKTKVVVSGVARAGLVPSEVCFELLNNLLDPAGVRLDYITMSRKIGKDGKVVGAHFGDSKIGGPVRNSILVIADPMGATGSTVEKLMQAYRRNYGIPKKLILINMIVAPEYLKRVSRLSPKPFVYAGRLDRGLSPSKVLKASPGRFWDQERGLTDKQYIVPGAGGIGEVMTNSWV